MALERIRQATRACCTVGPAKAPPCGLLDLNAASRCTMTTGSGFIYSASPGRRGSASRLRQLSRRGRNGRRRGYERPHPAHPVDKPAPRPARTTDRIGPRAQAAAVDALSARPAMTGRRRRWSGSRRRDRTGSDARPGATGERLPTPKSPGRSARDTATSRDAAPGRLRER